MKKIIGVAVLGGICLFIYFFFSTVSATPEEIVAHYKERWGMDIPVPDELIEVWATEFPARGDGEWVTELNYAASLTAEQLPGSKEVTDENMDAANRPGRHFIDRVQKMYSLHQDDSFVEAMEGYSTDLAPGDFYFHQADNGDFDTFTAIYQRAENQILLFEWHQ